MKFVHILQAVLWVLILLNFWSIFINTKMTRQLKKKTSISVQYNPILDIDLSALYPNRIKIQELHRKRRATRNRYNTIITNRHSKPDKRVHKSPITRDGCYEYDDGYQYVNNGESDYIFID